MIILLILSILLESIISNIVNISFLEPCILVTTLLFIYPYYKNKKIKYIIICTICGLLYDILFTNTLYVNTIFYTIYGLFITFLYEYIDYNIYSFNILNLLSIIFYRVIIYLLLSLLNYFKFDINILFNGIINSIILNIIYGFILFKIKKRY